MIQIMPRKKLLTENKVLGLMLLGAATFAVFNSGMPDGGQLSHDQARQEVLNALEIEQARQDVPGTILVGTGCGETGDDIMVALEEDLFPYGCRSIEVHHVAQ